MSGLITRWKQESIGNTDGYSPMRMQQSDKYMVKDSTKGLLTGTGTGTDFDLNNREPDVEAVDEDVPSDGVHEVENNTLEGDATR